MAYCGLFVLVLLATSNIHTHCLDWSGPLRDNAVLSVCVGDDVTLPWDFQTAENEVTEDIKWEYETNSTSKLIAFYSSERFMPTESYEQRVKCKSNGSLTMNDVTLKDSGMYSIRVEVQSQDGVSRYQRSASLQVKDSALIEDRKVHVQQEGDAVWDNATRTFTITLSCGTFRFTEDRPTFDVQWTAPTGGTLNSTKYSNGRFYLSLPSPVVGGTYTCRIPPNHLSHTCLTDSRHDNDFVLVDSVKVNVLQTIFEQKTLREEDEKLKAENEKLQSAVDKLKEEDGKLNELLSRITKVIDQCPRSWTLHGESSCYKYISTATTWQAAKVQCENMGASLVEIDSQAENSFVFKMVNSKGAKEAWLGLSDLGEEGVFLLPSGQLPAFTKWHSGEPNDSSNREDCAEFMPGRSDFSDRWNDAPCGSRNPFVCEQHLLY
uniref:C-type lectin n=1 Tax=Littorina littorea TaxID=31216 RepID=A0A0A7RW08_LITLI|nr:C-type lectin [Littorina littorea]